MPTNVVQQDDYSIREPAYLLVEGAGIHGSFEISGTVTVRRNGVVHISAKGTTPAQVIARQHGGSIRFHATAMLKSNGHRVQTVQLETKPGPQAWDDDSMAPIGSATVKIPNSHPDIAYSIVIEGGYFYDTGAGIVQPMPGSGTADVQLRRHR
ncbi:hypothetical protein QWY84_07865 [Aquisalimonas lutea]|uniref:hypothetical protein n=1 Tax=Aquisalimonas lutea TaxID=1327750 RepID=UPI0025B4AE68|nr:hypothetical protein [Aquisalimonas lutea]MDN3517520.1 hypothetical protein [Aquisalimonas lutea]